MSRGVAKNIIEIHTVDDPNFEKLIVVLKNNEYFPDIEDIERFTLLTAARSSGMLTRNKRSCKMMLMCVLTGSLSGALCFAAALLFV